MNQNFTSNTQAVTAEKTFMSQVYGWMSSALALSGFISWYIANFQQDFLLSVLSNPIFFWGIIIAQFGLVITISAAINKISAKTAVLLFFLYAALTGLTLSSIFLIYTAASIATTFFVTAGTFGAMSLYGYFTKTDLTSVGNILFMGLIGLIIASLVNVFLNSEALYWVTTFIGVFIFVGLTAYDTQKIKHIGEQVGFSNDDSVKKMAIFGALSLYLDFINLFLYLLRLFGSRD